MHKRSGFAFLLATALVSTALGQPYNAPTVDGHVTIAPDDWETGELGVTDPPNDCRYYPVDADLSGLYVTWDGDNLYVGITTTNGPGAYGNGYLLFIDVDAQEGITGGTDWTNANFYPRHIRFPTMGADVVMGGWNLQYTFDVRHCSNPTSTTPLAEAYARSSFQWKHVEARLSWNGLFGLGQGVVPPGTTLRFIAAIVGGGDSGAYDAMPTSSTAAESDVTTPWDAYTDLDTYSEVVVDANGDRVPDEAPTSAERQTWGLVKQYFRR